MYKSKNRNSFDIKCLSFSAYLQEWVQGYDTGSYNDFEVSSVNETLKIIWKTNITSSLQSKALSSISIENLISDNVHYSSSFGEYDIEFSTKSFTSQSLYYLDNNLNDQTIKCVGYASSGSERMGYVNSEYVVAQRLVNYLDLQGVDIEEVDVSVKNNILNSDIFINDSTIDLSLVSDFCNLYSLETGSLNYYDVSNTNTHNEYNHQLQMYGIGLSNYSENIFGKSKYFVSNYGNQLARKLAINEIKERRAQETKVEILFIEGKQKPEYIRYVSDGVEYTADINLYTKEYILNSFGISDSTNALFNNSYFS